MTRLQFWTFTLCCLMVAGLMAADLILSSKVHDLSQELANLEGIISRGQDATRLNQQIATRIYQLSADDPALKQLMVRNQIIIRNEPTNSTPTPTPPAALPPTPVPAPTPAPTSSKTSPVTSTPAHVVKKPHKS